MKQKKTDTKTMNKVENPAETSENIAETTGKKKQKKQYPLLPYLIGLFVMVVVLVVLSYLMQLRNKQELKVPSAAVYTADVMLQAPTTL